MKRAAVHATLLAALAVTIGAAHLPAFQQPRREESPQSDREAQIERGRYLVHDVAQCIVCHSPKDSRGNVIEHRLLSGSPMPVKSPYPSLGWALYCPPIARLPGWEKQDAVHLLQHGRRPDGRAPRAPMPQFHMTEDDAAAVVEYLMSIR